MGRTFSVGLAVWLALVGCGRFGFDATEDRADGGDGDGGLGIEASGEIAAMYVIDPADTGEHFLGGIAALDGGFVMAGSRLAASRADGELVRFKANGDIDATFGNGGTTLISAGGSDFTFLYGITSLTDGRFVIAGDALIGAADDAIVVGLDATGAPDATYGSGGARIVEFGPDADSSVSSVELAGGDSVVCGSRGYSEPNPATAIARLSPEGDFVNGFGVGGIAILDLDPGDDRCLATGADATGIFVAGFIDDDLAITRVGNSGVVDQSFATLGTFRRAGAAARAIAVTPGRVVVAANLDDIAGLLAVNSSGARDDSFGAGAMPGEVLFGAAPGIADAIAVQKNGKLIVSGTIEISGQQDGFIARVTADGQLDPTFADDGLVTVELGDDERVFGVAIGANGEIGAVGLSKRIDGLRLPFFVLVR